MPAETHTVARSADEETVLKFYREWKEQRDNVSAEKDAEKAIINAAGAAYVHAQAMKLADKIVKMGPRDGKTLLDKIIQYVELISGGMMTQKELFDEERAPLSPDLMDAQRSWNSLRAARKSGEADGRAGLPRTTGVTRYPDSKSPELQEWFDGWGDGNEEYIAKHGQEIRPKPDSTRPELRRPDPEDSVS